jgi:hypothetical protein
VSRVIGWYFNKDGKKRIMWVHAPLGYGKTAIAGTVKEKIDAMGLGFDNPVGATFFFWRTSPERNSPARFIITLAYQLAETIPKLQPLVDAVIKSKPRIVKMALERQLDELIVKPFKSLSNLEEEPIRLIIVDGIDECINSARESCMGKQDAEDQEAVQVRVLDLILQLYSHNLPLCFLVLSRPEAWIDQHLRSPRFRNVVEPLDLYEVGDHMNDVKRFVRAELSRIATSFGFEGVDEEWTDEQALVQKSEGHMVYAATVIRHIDDKYANPRALLKAIVSSPSASTRSTSHSAPLSSLYELYRQIMRSCPERNQSLMREVLEDTIVALSDYQDYVSVQDTRHEAVLRVLDGVSKRSPGDGLRALRPLHAVLRIGDGNEGTDIDSLFIHSSFREFLEDPQLSFEFAVDLCKGRERRLSSVLDYMSSITTDTIGHERKDAVIFIFYNLPELWTTAFVESRETRIDLMKKTAALDLTACIIQCYLYSDLGYIQNEEPYVVNDYSQLFKFFVRFGESDGHPDILSVFHMVTSHIQTSLDNAFTLLLKSSTCPALSNDIMEYHVGYDCVQHLELVISQSDWRENKLVQALAHPGPNGMVLFWEVVFNIGNEELLKHIYEIMVQEKNPILEEQDGLLRQWLGSEAKEGSSDLLSDSDQE